ncbi:hypothetical protein G3480_16960 [Thiorhodococcus mannitoliphagus]|uniref:Uncharacterized protein n=1 Tax=Thiorhodococcus mannitoliphagus TaxID=329406 RepID=A0A6P1DY17_9GAMM|nr:hypothetical protein [Thiorhodococcus mannitoliphagus]NEX21973.1 hypothetical protein [Thiorhodococcus mannitoliphagus]
MYLSHKTRLISALKSKTALGVILLTTSMNLLADMDEGRDEVLDADQPVEVLDAAPREEVLEAAPREEVLGAEQPDEILDAGPRREALDAEQRREVP